MNANELKGLGSRRDDRPHELRGFQAADSQGTLASPASTNERQQKPPPGLQVGLQLHVFSGPCFAQAFTALPSTHCPPAAVQSCGVPFDAEVQPGPVRPRRTDSAAIHMELIVSF
jgi:hypothetical protein